MNVLSVTKFMLRFIEIDGLLIRKFVANVESTKVNTRHRRGSIAPAAREAGMEDDDGSG